MMTGETKSCRFVLLIAVVTGLAFSAGAEVPPEASTPIVATPELVAHAPVLLLPFRPTAVIDFYAPAYLENGPPDSSRARVRSIELGLSGPADAIFDATLTVSGHDNAGVFAYDLHEAFFSTDKLLPSSRLKVGKMLLGLGPLNRTHQHAWPFASAPRVQERFFSDQAVIDTAIEYTYVISPGFELTLGGANGHTFGHSNSSGVKPLAPTHYVHPKAIFSSGEKGLEVGATYVARNDRDSTLTRIAGLDFIYAERSPAGRPRKLIQSEIYHRFQHTYGVPIQEELGAYVYGETAMTEALNLGLRLDAFTRTSLTSGSGERRSNLDYAAVPVITYRTGESSFVRASYSYLQETMQGTSDRAEQLIELQLVAVLGGPETRPETRPETNPGAR